MCKIEVNQQIADGRNHLICLSEKLMDANEPNADLVFAPECGIHRAILLQFKASDKLNLCAPWRAFCHDVSMPSDGCDEVWRCRLRHSPAGRALSFLQ